MKNWRITTYSSHYGGIWTRPPDEWHMPGLPHREEECLNNFEWKESIKPSDLITFVFPYGNKSMM